MTKPELQDAITYGATIGLPDTEAEWFFDHFTANGWRVGGKTPMHCWKAAMRNWHRRWKARQSLQDARHGVFATKPTGESVWALTERRKALEADMARLAYRSRHESPLGNVWKNETDRQEYLRLKREVEELNRRIAGYDNP
jgi:hypothetical protein